jgi:hypothetical protein
VLLLPIRLGHETLGVVTLGEMRSPAREPFSDAKRRRSLEVLERCVAAAAPAWQAGRLERQRRGVTTLLRLVRRLAAARTPPDLLAGLAVEVAHWLGAPVRAVLLGAAGGRRAAVLAEWKLPRSLEPLEAAQLLLAIVRGSDRAGVPVSAQRVAHDPLDPLHDADAGAEGLTRIGVPLVAGDRLLGVVALYVEHPLERPAWDADTLRRLAEVAAAWLEIVGRAEEEVRRAGALRAAAWDLLDAHRPLVAEETLAAVRERLERHLAERLHGLAAAPETAPGGPAGPVDAGGLADAVLLEVRALLAGLGRGPGPRVPVDAEEAVRQAVRLAGLPGDAVAVSVAGPLAVLPWPGFGPALARVLGLLGASAPAGSRLSLAVGREGADAVVQVTAAGAAGGLELRVPLAAGGEPGGAGG